MSRTKTEILGWQTSTRLHHSLVSWAPPDTNRFSDGKEAAHVGCYIYRFLILKMDKSCQTRTLYLWSLDLQPPPWLHRCGLLDSAKPYNRTPPNPYQKHPAGQASRGHQNVQQELQFSILHFRTLCCTVNSSVTLLCAEKGGDGYQDQQVAKILCIFPECHSALGSCAMQERRAKGKSSLCVWGPLCFSFLLKWVIFAQKWEERAGHSEWWCWPDEC